MLNERFGHHEKGNPNCPACGAGASGNKELSQYPVRCHCQKGLQHCERPAEQGMISYACDYCNFYVGQPSGEWTPESA
jgi:hypothetical protein